jgi:hypothetical protein
VNGTDIISITRPSMAGSLLLRWPRERYSSLPAHVPDPSAEILLCGLSRTGGLVSLERVAESSSD